MEQADLPMMVSLSTLRCSWLPTQQITRDLDTQDMRVVTYETTMYMEKSITSHLLYGRTGEPLARAGGT